MSSPRKSRNGATAGAGSTGASPARRISRILCHANRSSEACSRAADDLARRLRDASFEVAEGADAFDAFRPELLVILGGDGFLMESLRHFGYPAIPVFGANFGSVGFLMNTKDSLRDLPRGIERWEFSSEEHAVLEARTHGEDGAKHRLLAFNDVVVERMTRQSLRLEISLDGAAFHQYAGDGFILSTTAGSTAYNLAAGGPVVHPSLDVMIITPLYPHRASPFHSIQFSLVVPLASTVRIVALDLPKRRMRVVADGEATDFTSSVEITASGGKVNLLRPSSHIFVQTLTRKFIGE